MKGQDSSQHVSLGCGTLILIAVVVAIFSGPAIDDLESKVNGLKKSVEKMQQTLDAQATSLREIKEMLRRSAESNRASSPAS